MCLYLLLAVSAQAQPVPDQSGPTQSAPHIQSQSGLEPRIVFLAGEAARHALLDDHRAPYFSRLQPLEMATKTGAALSAQGLAAQRAETRRRYRAAVRDFSAREQVAIRALVADVAGLIARSYPRLAALPWRFIKVSNRIEGGLPHTRGRSIVLSQRVCDELVQAYRSGSRKTAWSAALGILLHEQVHVLQRQAPALFTGLYTQGWGFLHTGPIPLTPWLRQHQIINPDGQDCCWVFPLRTGKRVHYIWPQLVLEGHATKTDARTGTDTGTRRILRMPQDLHMIAVHVRPVEGGFRVVTNAQGKPVFDILLQVEDYTRVFGISYNLYHPNEIAADMLSKLVMYDALVAHEAMPKAQRALITRALAPIRYWAQHALGAQHTSSIPTPPIMKGAH